MRNVIKHAMQARYIQVRYYNFFHETIVNVNLNSYRRSLIRNGNFLKQHNTILKIKFADLLRLRSNYATL